MVYFSQSREVDTISRVHGQIDELKDIMVKNIGMKEGKSVCSFCLLFPFHPICRQLAGSRRETRAARQQDRKLEQ